MRVIKVTAVMAALVASTLALYAASDYPKQPIQIVVPFTAGGNTDAVARLLAERMQASLKQPVTVVNRAGAGTNIGAASVATADPDGYTMLLNAPASFVINQFIYNSLTYDPDTAFTPACLAAKFPNILVVHPSLGVKTIQELIDKAKANPGKLTYAIAGIGATSHLAGALFSQMAGVDALAITYKGTSQSVIDLVAGRVDYTIDNLGPLLPFIKSGKLIALGVATGEPISLLPDVPTISSVLKGYELSSWNMLALPAKTPKEIVDIVSKECNRIVQLPEVAEKMRAFGSEPVGGTPEQMQAFLKAERVRWENAVKAAKIPKQ
jgi:tripartite-type tricarboxylate transporter receptor subunit TctC